jgi:beta-glucosidase
VIGCDDHRELAREVAAASTVLLRNDDSLLPLDASSTGRIALLGRLAAVRNLGDGGSSDVRSSRVVTPLEGLRARFGDDCVVHADDDASIAAGADVVVVVVGYTKADEGECIEAAGLDELARTTFPPIDHPTLGSQSEWAPPPGPVRPPFSASGDVDDRMAAGGDRTSLRLSAADESLIAAAAELNDNVIVVVVGGSAVVMPWAATVRAVLMTWYSGVEGGSALADVLAGDVEPTGRLPFAVPTDPDHLAHFDRDATEITYDLFHGQWKLDRDGHAAQYPFGWGLGWGAVDVVGAEMSDESTLVVSVRNPGRRPLRPVVFVHAGVGHSRWERPRRRLVGFRRLDVGSGATADVEIEIDWSMLDVRVEGEWVTEHGEYVIEVGRHAGDLGAIAVTLQR